MPARLTHIVRRSPRSWDPEIMVIHTTEGHNREGVGDLIGLASFFERVDADATFGVDEEGNSIRMKPDDDIPWTQTASNSRSLSIEQVGFASSSKTYWIIDYHNGLRTVAGILATWSSKYGIPLRYSTRRGVCSHNDLPGDHWDPGPNYPFKYVIYWARYIKLRRQGKNIRALRYRRYVKRVQKRWGRKHPTTHYR